MNTATPDSTDRAPIDSAALAARLTEGARPVPLLRAALRDGDRVLRERFAAGEDVAGLVTARAALVDAVLLNAWRLHVPSERDVALVAVGGYGRGELHPCSDVDVMVLLETPADTALRGHIEDFIALLWDIGLEAGHSVRTLEECIAAARDDITVATSLMEARLLAGDTRLFARMRRDTSAEFMWPAREFFLAKRREQQERHAKYHNTAYRLEPNIKESPGGLRDIQMVGWVANRHFGARTLHDLVAHHFLTEEEFRQLDEGRRFLWQVRFALHLAAGRREDRLLFDAQLKLAQQFGYRDAAHERAVERFMQRYYRTVMELSRLNEMLLQLLEEAILLEGSGEPAPIDARFQERNGFLEATSDDVFRRHPSALLEIFHILQQHPRLRGVSAHTIRLIRRDRELIDEAFRADPRNHKIFMDILRNPQGVTHELRRMNGYGILGRYIPEFGAVIGRMQFDLFHVYTVDEHILFVVSNLRRFALSRFDHEFPDCSRIMQALPKPELAYLAGLFHDIAKGRGGDHSELGARDAEVFCLRHGLSRYDARLVAWLVENHLLLSITAQKKDIADPRVIHEFAEKIGDQLHLDYLYVLTVADVRATNPELWNSWKATLFAELYRRTRDALRRGLENPIDKDELIAETQTAALELLAARGLGEQRVRAVWSSLSDEYFLRHSAEEVAWHTEVIDDFGDDAGVVVQVRREATRGGTAVFIHAPHDGFIFGGATAVLDQLGLTILDARIVTLADGRSLHTYLVLEDTGEPITEEDRIEQIQRVLQREIGKRGATPMAVTRRAPRQVRLFETRTEIVFSDDERNGRTILEISTGDHPGLLSEIGRAFQQCGIHLHNARVTTVGERAEDVFYITDTEGRPLRDEERRLALAEAIRREIDSPTSEKPQ